MRELLSAENEITQIDNRVFSIWYQIHLIR